MDIVDQVDQPGGETDMSAGGDSVLTIRESLRWVETLAPRGCRESELRLRRLQQAFDGLCVEHGGMAEELLAVYEQLGVIFAVTRALPGTEGEREVLRLFYHCLRNSFSAFAMALYRPAEEGFVFDVGDWIRDVPDLPSSIDEAVELRDVLVRNFEISEDSRLLELMVSPIFSGTECVSAIVMARYVGQQEFRASDMAILGSLSTFCGDLVRNQRLMEELQGLSATMVQSLVNAVDQKDKYTAGHSTRVAFFADQLGRLIGLDDDEQRMLQWSGLLHDVGKIGIRDAVLKKNGPLSDDEMDHMREHPERSHEVVREVPQLKGALDGVRYHHEHYDGSGYPSGLVGEAIPLQARIVQIADVFDALTSTRAYRKSFTWQKALDIMAEEAGTTLDPRLYEKFANHIRDLLDNETWEQLVRRAEAFTTGWRPRLNVQEN